MSTQRLLTLPYMVCRLQRPPGHLESAIADLKIVPTLILNETAYYSTDDETRISDELHRRTVAWLEQQHKNQART